MKIEWLIIDRSLTGSLSEAEQKKLDCWLSESPGHVKMYERIKNRKASGFAPPKSVQWREEFLLRQKNSYRRALRRLWLIRLSPIAAIIVIGVGIYLLQLKDLIQEQPVIATENTGAGRNRVQLTTSSGQVIELASLSSTDTLWMNGALVQKEEHMLCYQASGNKPGEAVSLHTISVPRGSEYSLQLSDGTKVWLNSSSQMSYPVVFSGKNRRVVFSGEAYFEVAPDSLHPFIVDVDGLEVNVLGTEFNLNTRSARQVRTILVKGKVSIVLDTGAETVLKPGELAEADVIAGSIQVSAVPVWKYTAWRQGEFAFENATIEEILEELALWYDLDIVYGSEDIRKEAFTGCLSRNLPLSDMLYLIESTTYVRFTVEGHRVIVTAVPQYK